MNGQLARFEQMIERLVEGPLVRLFAGQLHPQEIVARLVRAMEDGAQDGLAPDRFRIHLHPADRDALLQAEPTLEHLLAQQLVALAQEAGLDLRRPPVVELQGRPDTPRQHLSVTAEVSDCNREQTRVLDGSALRRRLRAEPAGGNYLIIGGQRHILLTRPLYTLGRSFDCDVVLSDSRVSRLHAQLRWRFGRYVLYDLGSTGGTTVNGHPITESVLEPGDVFSLAGVDIIFGRDRKDDAPLIDGDGEPTRTWARPPDLPRSP